MSFKNASRLKLRFNTSKGLLSTEQLWDLKKTPLATIIRALKKELAKSEDGDLAFLDTPVKAEDKELQLKYNIAKEIYLTMAEEEKKVSVEAEKKRNNAVIEGLIAQKQNEALSNKSLEELKEMLED